MSPAGARRLRPKGPGHRSARLWAGQGLGCRKLDVRSASERWCDTSGVSRARALFSILLEAHLSNAEGPDDWAASGTSKTRSARLRVTYARAGIRWNFQRAISACSELGRRLRRAPWVADVGELVIGGDCTVYM